VTPTTTALPTTSTVRLPGTPSTAAPAPAAAAGYLSQIRLSLDPAHALGIDGHLTDLSELQTVRDFANSVTFPYPVCQK
jgi:hypothetical protein